MTKGGLFLVLGRFPGGLGGCLDGLGRRGIFLERFDDGRYFRRRFNHGGGCRFRNGGRSGGLGGGRRAGGAAPEGCRFGGRLGLGDLVRFDLGFHLVLEHLLGGFQRVFIGAGADRLGDDAGDQLDGADGIIVAGDDEIDRVGVAIRIHDGDDRDAQPFGLGHGDGFTLDVHDEEGAGQVVHTGDTRQVVAQFFQLVPDLGGFLLEHGLEVVLFLHLVELEHAPHAAADGFAVGQGAAEPAGGHVELAGSLGGGLDDLLRLLLGSNEQQVAAFGSQLLHEGGGILDGLEALGQVNDMDAVALVENVTLHFRIPALGLVSEMQAGIEQVLDGYGVGGWDDGFRNRCFSSHSIPPCNCSGRCRPFGSVIGPENPLSSALRQSELLASGIPIRELPGRLHRAHNIAGTGGIASVNSGLRIGESGWSGWSRGDLAPVWEAGGGGRPCDATTGFHFGATDSRDMAPSAALEPSAHTGVWRRRLRLAGWCPHGKRKTENERREGV